MSEEQINLKDLLQKSPLEMSDDELKANIEKLQGIRRIPDLRAAFGGKKRSAKSKEPEQSLEDALLLFAKTKETSID